MKKSSLQEVQKNLNPDFKANLEGEYNFTIQYRTEMFQ